MMKLTMSLVPKAFDPALRLVCPIMYKIYLEKSHILRAWKSEQPLGISLWGFLKGKEEGMNIMRYLRRRRQDRRRRPLRQGFHQGGQERLIHFLQ